MRRVVILVAAAALAGCGGGSRSGSGSASTIDAAKAAPACRAANDEARGLNTPVYLTDAVAYAKALADQAAGLADALAASSGKAAGDVAAALRGVRTPAQAMADAAAKEDFAEAAAGAQGVADGLEAAAGAAARLGVPECGRDLAVAGRGLAVTAAHAARVAFTAKADGICTRAYGQAAADKLPLVVIGSAGEVRDHLVSAKKQHGEWLAAVKALPAPPESKDKLDAALDAAQAAGAQAQAAVDAMGTTGRSASAALAAYNKAFDVEKTAAEAYGFEVCGRYVRAFWSGG